VIATEGDEVVVAFGLVALQTARHSKIVLPHDGEWTHRTIHLGCPIHRGFSRDGWGSLSPPGSYTPPMRDETAHEWGTQDQGTKWKCFVCWKRLRPVGMAV
jgi:hypothetical protein